MDPNERNQDEFSLDSILEEYRGFDPEAPEETPMPDAAFMTHRAEATLIDPGPEPEEADEVIELEALEDVPEPEAAEAAPVPEVEAPDYEAEEEYVREYHPHETEPAAEPEEPDSEASNPFSKLRDLFGRSKDEPEEPEPEPEFTLPEDEPEEPTQVFRAVAEVFGEDRSQEAAEVPEDEEFWAQEVSEAEGEVYASADAAAEPDADADEDDAYDEDDEYEEVERRSFREAVIRPISLRIAMLSYRSKERRRTAREEASIPEDLGPEPAAKTASKFYGQKIGALQRRGRLALVLSLIFSF